MRLCGTTSGRELSRVNTVSNVLNVCSWISEFQLRKFLYCSRLWSLKRSTRWLLILKMTNIVRITARQRSRVDPKTMYESPTFGNFSNAIQNARVVDFIYIRNKSMGEWGNVVITGDDPALTLFVPLHRCCDGVILLALRNLSDSRGRRRWYVRAWRCTITLTIGIALLDYFFTDVLFEKINTSNVLAIRKVETVFTKNKPCISCVYYMSTYMGINMHMGNFWTFYTSRVKKIITRAEKIPLDCKRFLYEGKWSGCH